MIRVYIAEDSPTVVHLFHRMLEGTPDFEVVGTARDGLQAKHDLQVLKPDVLVTDLHMPGLDGYELISWVMDLRPLPILVLSDAIDREGQTVVSRCLALGALEARTKPVAGTPEQFARSRAEFQSLLRTLSGVQTVRHLPPGDVRLAKPRESATSADPGRLAPEIVAIGASTGGHRVIQTLLERLPRTYPLPILLALHIDGAFADGLASMLEASTSLRVRLGCASEPPEGGTVYLAAGGHHLTVTRDGRVDGLESLVTETLTPSVDRLFTSVAVAYGPRACGIILTGMGRDGAVGLKAMRMAGATTFGQDESSCVVYGMPKVAAELGAVERLMSPAQMADALLEMGRRRREKKA